MCVCVFVCLCVSCLLEGESLRACVCVCWVCKQRDGGTAETLKSERAIHSLFFFPHPLLYRPR